MTDSLEPPITVTPAQLSLKRPHSDIGDQSDYDEPVYTSGPIARSFPILTKAEAEAFRDSASLVTVFSEHGPVTRLSCQLDASALGLRAGTRPPVYAGQSRSSDHEAPGVPLVSWDEDRSDSLAPGMSRWGFDAASFGLSGDDRRRPRASPEPSRVERTFGRSAVDLATPAHTFAASSAPDDCMAMFAFAATAIQAMPSQDYQFSLVSGDPDLPGDEQSRYARMTKRLMYDGFGQDACDPHITHLRKRLAHPDVLTSIDWYDRPDSLTAKVSISGLRDSSDTLETGPDGVRLGPYEGYITFVRSSPDPTEPSARPPTEASHVYDHQRDGRTPSSLEQAPVTVGSEVGSPTPPTRRLSDDQLHAPVTPVINGSIAFNNTSNNNDNSSNDDIKGQVLETFIIQKSWTAPPPAYTATAPTPSMGAISNYYQRRLARANTDTMRFETTTRPTLTPFGQRVLNLSERKLYALEAPLGGRDEATLLRGVLVREAVKSAWRSVETGQQVEVNDWQSTQAMGLDVIGEEEEEDEEQIAGGEEEHEHESIMEQRSERWFEELVQSFGEDDGIEQHEWIESQVGDVEYDDFDDEAAAFEHYTLPSPPPPSPLQVPASPSSPSSTVSSIESPTFSVEVDIVETPDYDEWDCEELEQQSTSVRSDLEYIPPAPVLSAACSPSSSPIPLISLTDDELDCDDLSLPPPLHRCSVSVPCADCDCDDDRESDGDCVTPSSSCDDLELSVGSLLGTDYILEDPGDTVRLAFDRAASKPDNWQTWHHHPSSPPPSLGLGLDITLDAF